MAGFAVMCSCIPWKRYDEEEPDTTVEGVYATYEEARTRAAEYFLDSTSGRSLEETDQNQYGDEFSAEEDRGDTNKVWVAFFPDSPSASTSLQPYRNKSDVRKLAAFAVMRMVSDRYGENPETELRSLFASWEEACREVKLDLIREYGKTFFVKYRDKKEEEVTAEGPKNKMYHVFIEQLHGYRPDSPLLTTRNASFLAPAPSKPAETSGTSLPPPKTVYTILHHEQLRSNNPLVPGITKTRCLDEAYGSLLEANQAAREYVIRGVLVADEPEAVLKSETAEAEWLDGFVIPNAEEENRDSEDLPYSVCIAVFGPNVEEITIEVKPLDFAPPCRRFLQDAAPVPSVGFPGHGHPSAFNS